MGQCDTIEVDLSPIDFNVEINQACFDVGIIATDFTIDASSVAGSGPPGPQGPEGPASTVPGPVETNRRTRAARPARAGLNRSRTSRADR